MKTTARLSVITGALATLLGPQVAFAGPYPIEQLERMLAHAESRLAGVEHRMDVLEDDIADQRVVVDQLGLQFKKTRLRADYANYQRAKSDLRAMEDDMAELADQHDDLLAYIEWIMVQFEAWEEINGEDGSDKNDKP